MGNLFMEIRKICAYFLIICDVGKIEKVISQIEKLIFIQEVQRTCGEYDIIVKAESTSSENLQKFVFEKINALGDVRSSMTLHCKPIF